MVEVNLGNNRGLRGSKGIIGFEAPRIVSNERTSRVGSLDTYIITLEDGKTYTYTVRNNSEQASSFCQALVDAYTTYTLTLSETEITTVTGDATINATLLMNNNPYSQQNIQLYNGTTLVSTETTDNDGDVSFTVNVTLDTTVFTLKYGNDVTATCTVYYKPYTFPLDGTDTLYNKRGANYTSNGELTVVNSGECWLTDYYLNNTGLWELEYEYYCEEGGWQMMLLITGQSASDNNGIFYTDQAKLKLGRIDNGYSTHDLGSDFLYQLNNWVEVKIQKISTNQLTITVGEHSITITDNKLISPSAFYFSIFSWSVNQVKIRNIRFNPATPNE